MNNNDTRIVKKHLKIVAIKTIKKKKILINRMFENIKRRRESWLIKKKLKLLIIKRVKTTLMLNFKAFSSNKKQVSSEFFINNQSQTKTSIIKKLKISKKIRRLLKKIVTFNKQLLLTTKKTSKNKRKKN